jgi:hypothetical protein
MLSITDNKMITLRIMTLHLTTLSSAQLDIMPFIKMTNLALQTIR